MAKKFNSIKLDNTQTSKMQKGLDDLEPHILDVAEVWHELTEEQKVELLENSPVLARFMALAERLR